MLGGMIDVNIGQPSGDMTAAWRRVEAILPGDDWWLWGVRCRKPGKGRRRTSYEAWAGNGEVTEHGYSSLTPADALDDLHKKLLGRHA